MRFLELALENFLSIEKERLSLDGRGVLLVSGENGAGKSSLTSKAISWALFGQTLKGVKGDAVVNVTEPNELCEAELRFEVGGKVHTIKRARNPTSLELDGNRFRVPADTQRAIEQLVGRDLESFLATDYFGQDRETDFLKMTPKAQMETMEAILRLSRLDQIVASAKDKATDERRILEVEERLVRSRTGQLEELDRQLRHAVDRHTHLQTAISTRAIQLRDLNDKENELRRSILKRPVRDAMVDRLRLEESLQTATANLAKHKAAAAVFQTRALHLRNEVASYRARLRDIVDKICPTCGGPVDEEVTHRLRQEQELLRTAYERVLKGQAEVTKWMAAHPELLRGHDAAVESLQARLADSNSSITKFEDAIEEIEAQRAELETEDSLDQAVILELVDLVDKMTTQKSELEEAVAANEAKCKRVMNRLSIINYWIDIFGRTFKNMILEQALPFLQERTEYHLRLLNNSTLKVSFSTQKTLKSGEERQQFTVVAYRDQGGQSEMALSGGERQIVSFAVGLALSELADSQTGSASNLMILDEPFTMLDEANCEEIVQYVTTELVKRKATILLISNDERMKALIPGGIHVKRGEDGYSRIV